MFYNLHRGHVSLREINKMPLIFYVQCIAPYTVQQQQLFQNLNTEYNTLNNQCINTFRPGDSYMYIRQKSGNH